MAGERQAINSADTRKTIKSTLSEFRPGQSAKLPSPSATPPSSYRPPVSSGGPQAGGSLLAGDLPCGGNDIGRRSIELRNQGLDLRSGHRRDQQPLPLGIGKEFRVLHGGVESRAQRRKPVWRDRLRRNVRTADDRRRGQKCKDLLL